MCMDRYGFADKLYGQAGFVTTRYGDVVLLDVYDSLREKYSRNMGRLMTVLTAQPDIYERFGFEAAEKAIFMREDERYEFITDLDIHRTVVGIDRVFNRVAKQLDDLEARTAATFDAIEASFQS